MNTLTMIVLATFLVGLLSLVGFAIFFFKDRHLEKTVDFLVSLSAGALIGSALFHLIPESILSLEKINEITLTKIFVFILVGFSSFWILEQFLGWHHCHKSDHGHDEKKKFFAPLVLLGDGIHNFLDGVIIAASFVVSIPTGIDTTLAVAVHEIPQEMGDIGVLIYSGMKKKKALLLNFITALTAVAGGVIGFYATIGLEGALKFLLPFAAGNFIYLATTDLIPEIKSKHQDNIFKSFLHLLVFVVGILLVFFTKNLEK